MILRFGTTVQAFQGAGTGNFPDHDKWILTIVPLLDGWHHGNPSFLQIRLNDPYNRHIHHDCKSDLGNPYLHGTQFLLGQPYGPDQQHGKRNA